MVGYTSDLNNINQLIFVMVKCGVLFEVRTEFLNNIYTSFSFKNGTLVKENLGPEIFFTFVYRTAG
jgi:hypothetical protein